MFRALVLDKDGDSDVQHSIQDLEDSSLPEEGDVTVKVEYSSLNYKDGMVLCGQGNLVRSYPHVPGVDLAGEVEASDSGDFKPGDRVLLTGCRVGEIWWGGYAQKAKVKSEWLVPRPEGLDARMAMAIGTAGFTAMLAVMALEEHGVTPDKGPVLVTGAAGGVGSAATAILAHMGHEVVAVTGRPETEEYLRRLGASSIVARSELSEPSKRPLESESWAGCVDSVGGTMLSRVLAQMKHSGSVAAVGLAGGAKLETTVIPFLLRGVNLLGIDSVQVPGDRRREGWRRAAKDLPRGKLEDMLVMARLEDLPELAPRILAGGVRGRVVVAVDD